MLSDSPPGNTLRTALAHDGLDEYRDVLARRRQDALDRLAVELDKRDARHALPHIEVRTGLGNCYWYAWRGGDDIVQADLPTVAAVEIAAAL